MSEKVDKGARKGAGNKSLFSLRSINPALPRNKKFVQTVLYGSGSCLSLGVALSVGISPAFAMDLLVRMGLFGVVFFTCLGYFFHKVVQIYGEHRKYENHPGPTRENFFSGNYYTMRRAQSKQELFVLLGQWCDECGDTFVFWRYELPKFFTSSPDVIRSMLTDISMFKKHEKIPNRTLFGQRITGTSSFLTVVGGHTWAAKRKVMSPYFTKIHLAEMFDVCRDYIERGMEKQMESVKLGETEVDTVHFYGELFQFFIGALGFDLDGDYVSKHAHEHNRIMQLILKWIPLQFGTYKQLLEMRFDPEVNETIKGIDMFRRRGLHILEYKQKELEEKGENPHDIVHHILRANKNLSQGDPTEFLMDDIMTIFLVIDNMGKTLSTVFTRLMREPVIYAKLVEEIRKADVSSLQNMDKTMRYTEMVLLEILRLHPTLMRGIRITTRPTTVDGVYLPSESMIFFGQLVLHQHPKYWKNPTEFIPERWESGSKDIVPFTYLPFVAGPRVCMGKHMAMLTMKLSIYYTLKNHNIRPPAGQEKEMAWDYRFTIVRPNKGFHTVFEPLAA